MPAHDDIKKQTNFWLTVVLQFLYRLTWHFTPSPVHTTLYHNKKVLSAVIQGNTGIVRTETGGKEEKNDGSIVSQKPREWEFSEG